MQALPATGSPQAPWHSGQRYDRATAGDTIHRYEQPPQIVATPPSICHSLGHLTKSIHFASIWNFQARSFPRTRDVPKISSRQSQSPRLFGSADLRQELIAIAHLNFTIRRCPTCDTILLAEARIIDGVSALNARAFGIPLESVRVESRSRGRRSQQRRSIESRIKVDGVFRQRTCGFAQHQQYGRVGIAKVNDEQMHGSRERDEQPALRNDDRIDLHRPGTRPRVREIFRIVSHGVLYETTIKTELIHRTDWETRELARAAVYECVEVWCNSQRPPFLARLPQPHRFRSATRNIFILIS